MDFLEPLPLLARGLASHHFLHQSHVFLVRPEGFRFQSQPDTFARAPRKERQGHLTVVLVNEIAFTEATAREHLHCIGRAGVCLHNSHHLSVCGPVFPHR